MNANSRTQNDRYPCRVTSTLTYKLDRPSGILTNVEPVEEVVAVAVSQVMTASARLEAAIASLATATKEEILNMFKHWGRTRHPNK